MLPAAAASGLRGASHRQQGQVWCFSSQPARHSPQKVWPQGAKEWEATIQSRHTTHSSSFSSFSARLLLPACVPGLALLVLPGSPGGLFSDPVVLESTCNVQAGFTRLLISGCPV